MAGQETRLPLDLKTGGLQLEYTRTGGLSRTGYASPEGLAWIHFSRRLSVDTLLNQCNLCWNEALYYIIFLDIFCPFIHHLKSISCSDNVRLSPSFPKRNACGPHKAKFSTAIGNYIASEHYFGNRFSTVQKRYSRNSPQSLLTLGAHARGLQLSVCLCICVTVCLCVFPILAPRAIRRTNSSISDFSAIRA